MPHSDWSTFRCTFGGNLQILGLHELHLISVRGIWREFMSHDGFQQEPFLYAWRGRGKRTRSPWRLWNSHPKFWIPSTLAFITFTSFIHRWTSYSHQMENSITPKQSSLLMTPTSTKPVFYSPRVLSPLALLLPACNAQEFTRTFPFPSSVHGHSEWAVPWRTTLGRWEDLFPSQASWPL